MMFQKFEFPYQSEHDLEFDGEKATVKFSIFAELMQDINLIKQHSSLHAQFNRLVSKSRYGLWAEKIAVIRKHRKIVDRMTKLGWKKHNSPLNEFNIINPYFSKAGE